MKKQTVDHPVTRDEISVMIDLMENRLSEKLSNRINDTYWKLIPIIIGVMAVSNGALFAAISMTK